MSLQVWLPLTKDLRQQGLANTTVTNNGATYSSTGGKLGGCYSFDGSTSSINTNINIPNFALDKTYSITCWVCPSGASGQKPIVGIGPDWSWTIFQQDTDLRFVQWDASGSRWGDPAISGVFSANTWVHIGVVWNQGTLLFYKNGEKIYEWTAPASRTIKVSSDTVKIGGNIYAWGNNYFNGKLNDVRIYNHCLSSMEVKELAKGLVLHYPLNRRGFGCNNLIPNTHGTYVSGWGAAEGSRAEFRSHSLDCSLPIEVGKTYTLSFDLKMILNTPSSTPYFLVYNTNYKGPHGRWIYQQCNSMLAGTYSVGDIIEKKIIIQFTPTSFEAGSYANDNIEFYSTYGTSNWYEVYNLKLEEGSIATPWCPNSSDTLYTTMGLNSTTEYDCSGYCNNGTRIGTFNWVGDTPKHSVSTVFPSGANYIDADRGAMVTDSITVSLWTKYSTWGNPISCTEGGGWNFEHVSNSIRFPVYVASVGYKLAESNIASSTLANEWHMITGTFDKTNVKIYIDGELKGTTETGSTNGIAYASSNAILIGAEASGTHAPASTTFVGNISDVRIYATALSDEDILNLYKQGHHE